MKSRFIPLIVSVFLTIILALWITDFVRDIIAVPLLYLIWLSSLIFKSLPDGFFWSVFILVVIILAFRSFSKTGQTRLKRKRSATAYRSPVEGWARLIKNAEEGEYSRWQLAKSLNRITWDLWGYEERPSLQEMENRLQTEALTPEIQAYFLAGLQPYLPNPTSRFLARWNRRRRSTPLSLSPETVVQYLEDHFDNPMGESS
jgi:hypothetical protein